LEFLILTAARTGEVTGARLEEISDTTWSIPASRTKSGRAHRVPLSPRALAIVNELRNGSGMLFPGAHGGLSKETMRALLKRMGPEVTVHGFRSTFRDWAAEQTNFPREVCEQALAHLDGSAVERAYRRSDLFEQRRLLMRMTSTERVPTSFRCELENDVAAIHSTLSTMRTGARSTISRSDSDDAAPDQYR
jgi:integrase